MQLDMNQFHLFLLLNFLILQLDTIRIIGILLGLIKNNSKLDDIKYFERVNWKYIAGFFDGDGCISLNYKDLEYKRISGTFSISQKYTPKFLEYLR